MNSINAQLERLFEFEKQLNQLLKDEEYEQFQQQQDLFTDQVKYLLDTNSEEMLATVITQLKQLEDAIKQLQSRSGIYFQELKEKSLLQRRNKKKIKAYK
ncbi:hypothetical protein [Psychromonas hadalis]|uniref:hypothetical protein n=1 Tax=Psychromonas hadalis TaxID=211669 RepID=UPI0003B56E01|nr:hypothetical protein [Psychromonas hadalis]